MADGASQAGDADSSRAPGLTSGLQGFVNVHRGALLLVPQWQCISSFVFYIVLAIHFPSAYHREKFDVSYRSCSLTGSVIHYTSLTISSVHYVSILVRVSAKNLEVFEKSSGP